MNTCINCRATEVRLSVFLLQAMPVSDASRSSLTEFSIFGISKLCNDLGTGIFFPLAWVHVLETVVLHVYSDLRKWLS